MRLSHQMYRHVGLEVYGRLGNNLYQLISAIVFCHCQCVKEIYFDNKLYTNSAFGGIGSFFHNETFYLPSGISLKFGSNFHLDSTSDANSFFNFNPSKDSSKPRVLEKFLNRIENEQLQLITADIEFLGTKILAKCLEKSSEKASKIQKYKDSALLHLRGEDVFGQYCRNKFDVPAGYPQPPLSFYYGVSKYLANQKKVNKFIILVQDDLNPTLSPLWRKLKSIAPNISVDVYSVDLLDSLPMILLSKYLVSSNGTFIPLLSLISLNTEALISFREHKGLGGNNDNLLLARNIQSIRVMDLEGRYTPDGSWSNLPCQNLLTLKYPEHFLQFDNAW